MSNRSMKVHPSALFGPVPDNSALRRRARIKSNQHGEQPGVLGDYPADLPNRVLVARGGAGQEGGEGPLSSPVIFKEGETWEDLLRQIRDDLRQLPERMSLEWRTRFNMRCREQVSFASSNIPTNVPAASTVALTTQTIPRRYAGYLEEVGILCAPAGALNSVFWSLTVNGSPHPEFTNLQVAANQYSEKLRFELELVQGVTVQITATNTGAVPVNCQATLIGYYEFLDDYKSYGGSPVGPVS